MPIELLHRDETAASDVVSQPKLLSRDTPVLQPVNIPIVDQDVVNQQLQIAGLSDNEATRPSLLSQAAGSLWNAAVAGTYVNMQTKEPAAVPNLKNIANLKRIREEEVERKFRAGEPITQYEYEMVVLPDVYNKTRKEAPAKSVVGRMMQRVSKDKPEDFNYTLNPDAPEWKKEISAQVKAGKLFIIPQTQEMWEATSKDYVQKAQAATFEDAAKEIGFSQMPEAKGLLETAVRGGAGLAGTLLQFGALKRVAPSLTAAEQFALQSGMSSGGDMQQMIEGYAMGGALHDINKVAAASLPVNATKAQKFLASTKAATAESVLFGGLAASQGAPIEEVATQAMLPFARRVVGVAKQAVASEMSRKSTLASVKQDIINRYFSGEAAKMTPEELKIVAESLTGVKAPKSVSEQAAPVVEHLDNVAKELDLYEGSERSSESEAMLVHYGERVQDIYKGTPLEERANELVREINHYLENPNAESDSLIRYHIDQLKESIPDISSPSSDQGQSPAGPGLKQPWEMSKKEWRSEYKKKYSGISENDKEDADRIHKMEVGLAIKEGKITSHPDYPDLTPAKPSATIPPMTGKEASRDIAPQDNAGGEKTAQVEPTASEPLQKGAVGEQAAPVNKISSPSSSIAGASKPPAVLQPSPGLKSDLASKDFLKAEFSTSSSTSKPVGNLNKKIFSDVVTQQDKMQLTTKQRSDITKLLYGKGNIRDLTIDELAKLHQHLRNLEVKFSDPQAGLNTWQRESRATSDEVGMLLKAAEKDIALTADALERRAKSGGYADNADIRRRQVLRDAESIAERRAWIKYSADYRRKNNRNPDLTNWYQDARYMFSDIQDRTGLPVYDTVEGIIYKSLDAESRALKTVLDVLKEDTPYSKFKFNTFNLLFHDIQSPRINEAMTEVADLIRKNPDLPRDQVLERSQLFKSLTDAQKDVMLKGSKLLSNDFNASEMRELRFFDWMLAEDAKLNATDAFSRAEADAKWKKMVSRDIQRMEPDVRKRLLEEGRAALADGKIKEWIKKQTFGTKEFYDFQKTADPTLSDNPLAAVSFDPELSGTAEPGNVRLSAQQTRVREGEAISRPFLQAVVQHLKRTHVANAVKEDYSKLQEQLRRAGITATDEQRINAWMWQMVHGKQQAEAPIRFAQHVTSGFWKAYSWLTTKLSYYLLRNTAQSSIAMGQLSPGRSAQSATRLVTGKANPYLAEAMRDRWSGISEKNAYAQDYLLLEQSGFQGPMKMLQRLWTYAKMGWSVPSQLMPLSDEITRKTLFPLSHQAAYDAMTELKSGKIDYKEFRREMMLDTLTRPQVDKLEQLVVDGNVKDFSYYYAAYKTENTLWRYSLQHRSMFEQTSMGRTFAGIDVPVRGMINIWNRNVWNPLKKGLVDKDATTVYQAVMAAAGTYVGLRLANEVVRGISGRDDIRDYTMLNDIIGYRPGSVGWNIISENWTGLIESINHAFDQHGQWSPKAIDSVMAGVGSKNLEMWFPLIDVQIAIYENANDAEGATFYKALRSSMDNQYKARYGKPHRYRRSELEKIQRIIFGGAKYHDDKSKDWNEMSAKERAALVLTGIRPKKR